MATAKRRNSSKRVETKKTTNKEKATAKRQLAAVILFGVGIFLAAVVFIPGEKFWNVMQDFLFGIFGVLTYLIPFYLILIAVFCTLDRLNRKVKTKIILSGIVVVLTLGVIDIFTTKSSLLPFFTHLGDAYKRGVLSGGFVGALTGHPISAAFGKTGAAITLIVLIFIFLMIVTGTTLIALFKGIAKPVRKLEETAQAAYREKAERKATDIDLPVDDPINPVREKVTSKEIAEKKKKLISSYLDREVPEESEPLEEEASVEIDEAIVLAKEEAAQRMSSSEFKEEVAKVESEIKMEQTAYSFPPIELLKADKSGNSLIAERELEQTADRLVKALQSFGVETRVVDISRGPTVTRFELQPSAGVKISKITNLADDIALNLATAGVRIEAPIPNKAAVGIEVPNKASNVVHIRDILESSAFIGSKSKLTIALGKDIGGNAIVGDISKMPHGLIAGATGSGKSVCINSIIISILYKACPDEVKLIMIDPKVVELGIYNGIPHLLMPVVTNPRKAAATLGWAVSEMEKRYQMFAASNVRDLDGYNRLAENTEGMVKLPRVVIIIDELADLMMTAPKEVEDSINRIAAKARAAGMHLIIATQRPSVDVVTGVIKANIPTRIAFAVSSQVDSRTILDMAGAEKLLGRGDMLFNPIGANKPSRVQGCFVGDDEVEQVVDFVKKSGLADYDQEIIDEIERQATMDKKDKGISQSEGDDDSDPMFNSAVEVAVENGQISTSMLQRKLKLGYARAARIIDQMHERGIVGPFEGAKPRQVLITAEEWLERKAGEE